MKNGKLAVLGVLVLVAGCREQPPPKEELPGVQNGELRIVDLKPTEGNHSATSRFPFGMSSSPPGPRFRECRPSFGSHSFDVFHCDVAWQYMGTTEYGDIYEIVIKTDKLKDTPPTIVRHIAYNGSPLVLFENSVVRVEIVPRGYKAATSTRAEPD